MVLESGAGRAVCAHVAVVCLLHTHTAQLVPDSLSCLLAAAPRSELLFKQGPASQLDKVFSDNWFLPKALFVLPVPGDTEGAGHSFACLSEHHQRGFCRGSSPRILISAVLPNNFPNAICSPK